MLQEFAVDCEVIVTSYPEIVRKSYAGRTGSSRVLRRRALMSDELDMLWILISTPSSAGMMHLCLLSVP